MSIDNYLNRIIQGDCIEKMKELPDKSVDMIFADPPYNMQLQGDLFRPNETKVSGVNDNWDKFDSYSDYDKSTLGWLKETKRILKDNGTIWVIGSFQNIFRVGKIIQDLKYWILNDILWIKTNPMPNFKGTRFNNAHETLIWASKNQNSKYTFHYKSMKAFNDDKQMRSDWFIPICNGGERLKGKDGKKIHSTQKPAELLYRVIISSTNPGDVILDPFMGTGTTGAVAKRLGRNFIGIEKEIKYIEEANKRIDKIQSLEKNLLKYPIEEMPPKVPFGNLVEKGILKIGEKLYSKDKKYFGGIMGDSVLINGEGKGSIHGLSAQILGKDSNNGWKFWYKENEDGNLISIDELRTDYIKKYITI